ncbi:MAG: PHP domain-containing protein [Treponema sp.]|nr:PHP domain-containing protein [Treponema sp.]
MLADLHNHSCLSPCGSLELSPRILVETAASKNIGLLALTDHNSSLNSPAFDYHCKRLGVIPLYGMEVTTQEEIHMVTLFSQLEAAMAFGDYIYSIITPFLNNPEKTGDQVYVDEDDNILGEVEYFLPNAAEISVDVLSAKADEYSGIVIPAHIDRPAFSMTSQLGVLVQGSWAAVECVRIPPLSRFGDLNSPLLETYNYPLITGSDAHYPEHIGRRPFKLDAAEEELLPKGRENGVDLTAFKKALQRRS